MQIGGIISHKMWEEVVLVRRRLISRDKYLRSWRIHDATFVHVCVGVLVHFRPRPFLGGAWRDWLQWLLQLLSSSHVTALPAERRPLTCNTHHHHHQQQQQQQGWQRRRISSVCSASLRDRMARTSAVTRNRLFSLSTCSTTSPITRYRRKYRPLCLTFSLLLHTRQ